MSAFKHFLIQDYLYLKHYARLNALAGYKCDDIDGIAASAQIVLHIQREVSLHINYCESFGISRAEIEATEESAACTVYTRYMESIGTKEDWFALQIALSSCLIGYGVIGTRLFRDPNTDHQSPYWTWIANYAAADFTEAVNTGQALLESHAPFQSPSKIAKLVDIFRNVTKYEALFWTSALTKATD